jgi:two-component system cell cycle sensor histidine kinase/response regulator CckA
VLTAEDGQKALAVAAAHDGPIHLLVTDVVMPEMGGVLAESLVRSRPGIRMIFMSGYTEETVVHHGVTHGNSSFLSKPFMNDALLRRVREVLDVRNSPGSPPTR